MSIARKMLSKSYPLHDLANYPIGGMTGAAFNESDGTETINAGQYEWSGTLSTSSNLRASDTSSAGNIRVTMSLADSAGPDLEVRNGTVTVIGTLSPGDTRKEFEMNVASDFMRLYPTSGTSITYVLTELYVGTLV